MKEQTQKRYLHWTLCKSVVWPSIYVKQQSSLCQDAFIAKGILQDMCRFCTMSKGSWLFRYLLLACDKNLSIEESVYTGLLSTPRANTTDGTIPAKWKARTSADKTLPSIEAKERLWPHTPVAYGLPGSLTGTMALSCIQANHQIVLPELYKKVL